MNVRLLYTIVLMGVLILRSSAGAAPPVTGDFYIGPSGSNSNPGTRESPWAISAINSKGATYAGTTVVVLDGTYDLSSINPSDPDEIGALDITGTSNAGSPTRIYAENTLGAHLTVKNGSTYKDNPVIGHHGQVGNIVIRGFRISGSQRAGVSWHGTQASYEIPGLVVEDCEIFDHFRQPSNPTPVNNCDGVWMQGVRAPIVRNCWFHDIYNGEAGNANACAVKMYHVIDANIHNNTVEDCHTAFYPKAATCSKHLIENNVVRNCTNGVHGCYDQATDGETSIIRFNLMYVDANMALPFEGFITNDFGTTTPWNQLNDIYNNTFACEIDPSGAVGLVSIRGDVANRIKFYNNIIYRSTGDGADEEFGDVSFAADAQLILDYNIISCPAVNFVRISNSAPDTEQATYTTIGNWRTGLAGAGAATDARDTNSSTSSPGLVLSGSGVARYRLGGGALAIDFGHVGGTSGGAAINCGFSTGTQTASMGSTLTT